MVFRLMRFKLARRFDYSAFPKYLLSLNGGFHISDSLFVYITNRMLIDATEGPFNALINDNSQLDDIILTNINLNWKYSESWDIDFSLSNLFDQDNTVPAIANAEFGIIDPNSSQRLQVSIKHSF